MRYTKSMRLLLALLLLGGCTTVPSDSERQLREAEGRIHQTYKMRIDEAAAAVSASTTTLKDHHIPVDAKLSAATELNSAAMALLHPQPSHEALVRWDAAAGRLVAGDADALKGLLQEGATLRVTEESLKRRREDLQESLRRATEAREVRLKEQLRSAQDYAKHHKYLIYIFASAGVACVIGGIFAMRLSTGIGVNLIIAGAGFSLTAYYITRSWFAWIAAIFAILVVAGIAYMVIGRWRHQRVLSNVVQSIDKTEEEEPTAIRKLKNRIDRVNTLADDEHISREKARLRRRNAL